MMTLTVMAIVAIVGLAAYCMVCERLADNRRREAARQVPDVAPTARTSPLRPGLSPEMH